MTESQAGLLAEQLGDLKERSGRSYEALARRTGISRSTLHRYCTGGAVPDTFGPVERIGLVCGADRAELAELYRRWAAADAARNLDSAPASSARQIPAPSDAARRQHGEIDGDQNAAAVPQVSRPAAEQPASRPAGADPAIPRNPGGLRLARLVAACLLVPAVVGSTPAASTQTQVMTAGQDIVGPAWTQHPTPVPPTLFGVTLNSTSGAMPSFRVGAVRLWDSGTRWAEIERQPGIFDWTILDGLVDGANRAGLPVLFTFGGTPGWASPGGPRAPYSDGSRTSPPDDLRTWQRFVSAVVSRYRGRIAAYELWVMVNDLRYYSGSLETLVEMTRRASATIRANDRHVTVVCPSMGRLWLPDSRAALAEFARLGGYEYCDVAGVKLYQRTAADPPETMLELTDEIDRTFHGAGVHPRLWSTGTTYDIRLERKLDGVDAENFASRFFLVGIFARYDRMYFYNWGGQKIPLVLQVEGGPPTRAAVMLAELERWLDGAQVYSCGTGPQAGLPARVFRCRFVLPAEYGGRPASILWTSTGRAVVSAEPGTTGIRHLDGSLEAASPGKPMQVTGQPMLVLGSAKH